jgi:hypothetical protein
MAVSECFWFELEWDFFNKVRMVSTQKNILISMLVIFLRQKLYQLI